ncbi:MAG: ribonuclease P protein component [Deltaproteobacteria bacterium]|nr:MAG: ribonuclease P protein component [Deltaproteobacteria bacterium]
MPGYERAGKEDFSFPKRMRLRRRAEFTRLSRKGKRKSSPHFLLLFQRNDLGYNRLGITVSRRIGNAVRRNRLKRRIREFFRTHQARFPQGRDMNFIARKGAADLSWEALLQELHTLTLPRKRCPVCDDRVLYHPPKRREGTGEEPPSKLREEETSPCRESSSRTRS